jgi:hypothetical protein
VAGHGAIVSPRSRNSVDYLVGVNTPKDWPSNAHCANITGDKCENGQADFWYSQGCFIGCPTSDNESGRRQIDLLRPRHEGDAERPQVPIREPQRHRRSKEDI